MKVNGVPHNSFLLLIIHSFTHSPFRAFIFLLFGEEGGGAVGELPFIAINIILQRILRWITLRYKLIKGNRF